MKNQGLVLALAGIIIFGFTGCSPKSITIEGKVSNLSGDMIIYWPTMDGIYVATQRDTLVLQADSTYSISFPAKENEKVSFYIYGKKYLGTIYAEPGKNVLNINTAIENNLNIKNSLIKENQIIKKLSQLQEDVINLRGRKSDAFMISKDTVASSVYEKLTNYALKIEKTITGVDNIFMTRAIQDVRMNILLAFMNQYFVINYQGTEETKKEWEAIYPKMLEYADINQPENVFSEVFGDVILNVAGIDIYMKNKQQPKDRDEGQQRLFDWYKSNLQGRVQEVAMANIILQDDSDESYSTIIPALYENFKELHPGSILIPALSESVQKNISFNSQEIPQDIHFLNTDSVRSFKEITDRYTGKVIFIDIWATWCGPCRQSFKHVEPLQKYAKENDIVLLYVSIDRPSDTDLWKKMAVHYNLEGEHVIVNDLFRMDIYNTFGNNEGLYIPHCAIINKKGELQFKKAAGTEDLDKLIEQLQEAGK